MLHLRKRFIKLAIMAFSRHFLSAILFACLPILNLAQNWNAIYSKELDAEYFMLDGQFEKAANKYKEIQKLIPQSANITFKVGYAYLLSDDKKHLSIEFFESASTSVSPDYDPRGIRETNAPPETFYFLGKAYQIANRFSDAINAYNRYKELIDPTHEDWPLVEKQISACKAAPELYQVEVPNRLTNLGDKINNDKSNFNAVISGDGQTLAYTSLSNMGYDVFVSKKKGNEWDKPRKITELVKGRYFFTASLSYDGTELYLVETMSGLKAIYVSYFQKGTWTKAQSLKKPINTKYGENHASISPDGKTLYFSSYRPGGYGGLDLYKSTRDAKGKWGEPVNLGSTINTNLDEDTPFLTPDSRYLFFSSQGHNSMGCFDIFYIDLTRMDEVVNLGYPINNSGDNLFFFPFDRTSGLMAAHNPKSLGQNDIFEVKVFPLINLIAEIKLAETPSAEYGAVTVTLTDLAENSEIISGKPESAPSTISQKVKPGKYRFLASGEAFEPFEMDFTIPDDFDGTKFSVSALLKPLPPPAPLLAEVTKETEVIPEDIYEEPVQQETTEPVEHEIIEPEPTREIIPEQAVTIVDQPSIEVDVKEEVVPEIEQQKPVALPKPEPRTADIKIAFSQSSSSGYTVQIMALRNPVETNFFSNLSNVKVEKGSDDLYRYTVGYFNSINEAKEYQKELYALGYKQTFIRSFSIPASYTIQVMALKIPKDASFFGNLPEIVVTKHSDDYHRYTVGTFSNPEEAQSELLRVKALGYSDAFVRKVITQ